MNASIRPSVLAIIAIRIGAAVALAGFMSASRAAAQAPDYAAIVAAADRTDADRQTDARRDPLKLLAFAAPRRGMKVLDMGRRRRLQHRVGGARGGAWRYRLRPES